MADFSKRRSDHLCDDSLSRSHTTIHVFLPCMYRYFRIRWAVHSRQTLPMARDRRNKMTLRVVGAGVGRTGTHSLKIALEQLLGGPCHHMVEILGDPTQAPGWIDAIEGRPVDWATMPAGYVSLVDWPGCSFWPELSAANPTRSCCFLCETRNLGTAAHPTPSFNRLTRFRRSWRLGWLLSFSYCVIASVMRLKTPWS